MSTKQVARGEEAGYLILVVVEVWDEKGVIARRLEIESSPPDNTEMVAVLLKTIEELKLEMAKRYKGIPRIATIEVYHLASEYAQGRIKTNDVDLLIDQVIEEVIGTEEEEE